MNSQNYQSNLFLKEEWPQLIFGALLSFFMASILLSGWPDGLHPNVTYPFTIKDDGAFSGIQRLSEGWVLSNERSGYPFGSDWSDYANADNLNFVLIKIISFFYSDWYAIFNLYFLITFPLAFLSAYCVFRFFGLNKFLALTTSMVFAFLPFHFLRIYHLFYTNYFHVPIFWYIALKVFRSPDTFRLIAVKKTKIFFCFLVLILLASLGLYFSLFGLIIISFAGFVKSFDQKSLAPVKLVSIIAIPILLGLFINFTPSLSNIYNKGMNPEVAQRSYVESELYGFKLTQLLAPRENHRNAKLAAYSDRYASDSPLVNENRISTLGVISSIGFLLSLFLVLTSPFRQNKLKEIYFISALILVLFLFGTIGGLGSVFAILINPSIRAWNRVSIFISFGSLLVLFLYIQYWFELTLFKSKFKYYSLLFNLFFLYIAFFDQTTAVCEKCNEETKKHFEANKSFVKKIESILPSGAAVYQLPYMPFPEVPDLNQLKSYDQFTGFLYSQNLKWSYGGIKGRAGDLFFRRLSTESEEKQIEIIKKLGFSGVYLDLRGYPQSSTKVYDSWVKILGAPSVIKADKKAVFFLFDKDSVVAQPKGLTPREIMSNAGYIVDHYGLRYHAEITSPLEFNSKNYPDYIQEISGLSQIEDWGRWSDANVKSFVRIVYSNNLPKRFRLLIKLQSFDPTKSKLLKVVIADQIYYVNLKPGKSDYEINVNINSSDTKAIDFIPPDPVAPSDSGYGTDNRKISVGFIRIQLKM
jgi:phosphoglycerol transferase